MEESNSQLHRACVSRDDGDPSAKARNNFLEQAQRPSLRPIVAVDCLLTFQRGTLAEQQQLIARVLAKMALPVGLKHFVRVGAEQNLQPLTKRDGVGRLNDQDSVVGKKCFDESEDQAWGCVKVLDDLAHDDDV